MHDYRTLKAVEKAKHEFRAGPSIKRNVVPNNNIAPFDFTFENKLESQEKSVLNQTFHLDSNKEERLREFRIEDAINGFLPRARSSGPRSEMSRSEDVRRVRSETASLFSTTCKLPLLDGTMSCDKKSCTVRPWSRTQDELRKFKETLKQTTSTAASTSNST
ncbi:unnamed protein product [Caenorhabditis bovis]|uniref:Uncharacterized protein n=1 Tax=Caenorhabditis bovis TaxID=2654633 RepID=A0A8S1EDS4_9PELO|nr:unnamed protein product [Caenorhabditis bovis]